jgi:hypothetical protein
MYRKETIRHMPTETRKLARLINDLDSVSRRLSNYLETARRNELDSRALLEWKKSRGDATTPRLETGTQTPDW